MTQRLPIPGQDSGTWGDILNAYLEVSLNGDGSLQTSALQNAGGVTSVNSKTPTNGAVTLTAGDVSAISQSSADSRYVQQTSLGASGGVATLTGTTLTSSQLPSSVANVSLQVWASAASGDTTGATDTAAISSLLNEGHMVYFPPGQTYYISATLELTGSNGWDMPDDTSLVWVGAAGGSVASTVAYTSTSVPPYYGSLVGGTIKYPKAKITSSTQVVYIAQPAPTEISTNIITDSQSEDNSFIAGSCGYVFDSNYNPGGRFHVEVNVIGQFDKCIYCRTSHAHFRGIQVGFGNDGIVFDNDSIGSGAPPINCQIDDIHSWEMVNSVIRLTHTGLITIVSATLENHDIGAANLIYADSTFNARAIVLSPWNVGGAYVGRLQHYGSGAIWIFDPQSGYANVWVGQVSGTAYVTQTIVAPQMVYSGNKTGYVTSSTTDVVFLKCGTVPAPAVDRLGVRFEGSITTGGNPVIVKLWSSTAAQTIGSAPASATQWGYTVEIPGSANNQTSVALDWIDAPSGTDYYIVSISSPNGTSITAYGQVQTYVPY